MQVKIIKSSRQTYWYANKIGDVFEVDKRTRMGGYTDYIVKPERRSDCEFSRIIDTVDCEELIDGKNKEEGKSGN
jgi:hypothetical protein